MSKLLQSIGNYAIINSILNSFFMNKRKLKTGRPVRLHRSPIKNVNKKSASKSYKIIYENFDLVFYAFFDR